LLSWSQSGNHGGEVRIIAKRALREFWRRVPQAKEPLSAWYADARAADWASPNAIKARYRSASILKNNRVVFNIAGNSYRLVVRINYHYRVVYVRFVGAHAEYDRIDAEVV
jgi:mRNA interferase HigB